MKRLFIWFICVICRKGLFLLRRLLRALLRRHLAARSPCLGEADGDGLLAALHLLARGAALQRAVLALVHRLLDLLACLLPVLCRHSQNLLSMCTERSANGDPAAQSPNSSRRV